MARIEVVMPQMGESIAEGTIVKWHKKVGDRIKKDETLLEISTDKVDSEIPSPSAGRLAEIVVEEQKTVPVNTVIAYIEAEGAVAGSAVPGQQPPATADASPVPAGGTVSAVPMHGQPAGGRFYSPLVLNIAQAEKVSMSELDVITGSGEGGRVTKRDVLAYVQSRKSGAPSPAAVAPPAAAPGASMTAPPPPTMAAKPVSAPELKTKYPAPDFEVLQMSNVQQRMAQHMVASVQTSPHVAAVHEVDMTEIVKHRAEHAVQFEAKEGFKLTYTPYIVDAVVKAIKKYPLLNSSIEGDKIIKKNFINLGLAVATDNGLIVPVIKHAEEKSFVGYARAINDLATRTRMKKLTPDDIQGGTFTISNFGVFNTMIGTPIISQPQVAILGTGAITKRPVVINDAIAIRSIAYFTLSFDHRMIDGAMGGMFLEQIVQNLEQFDIALKI
jgi:pyruvate/2-oxoglutarate dehydrogenase complex dihydrolipoamide acyltransferase (E2) component